MGVGAWDDKKSFSWHRIRDNVCLLSPATIDSISQIIVTEGHTLVPNAIETVRADSFVMETLRRAQELCVQLNLPATTADDIFGSHTLQAYIVRTERVQNTTRRRVINEEMKAVPVLPSIIV